MLRVLVVDDNHDVADALAALLRFLGHEAHIVYDGASALELMPRVKPSVVMTDLGMPRMTGYQVANEIRSRPDYRDIKLIAVTAWGEPADRRRTHAAGFDHHLIKPVDIDILTELLASIDAGTE